MAVSDSIRSFLEGIGVDVKLVCVGIFSACSILWGASAQYSAFKAHLDHLDQGQTQLQTEITHQDEVWAKTLAENTKQTSDSLKALSDSSAKERAEISNRVNALEAWRIEEQHRDDVQETTLAKLGEQVSGVNNNVTDLKGFIEELVVRTVTHQLPSPNQVIVK